MSKPNKSEPIAFELNQRDFDDRLARRTAGHQSDEDLRMIKMYERAGYRPGGPAPDDADWAPKADRAGSATETGEASAWPGNSTETSSDTTPKSGNVSTMSGQSSARTTRTGSRSR